MDQLLKELESWLKKENIKELKKAGECSCFEEVSEEDAHSWCATCYEDTFNKIQDLKKNMKFNQKSANKNVDEKLLDIAKEIIFLEENSEKYEEDALQALEDGNELEYSDAHETYLEMQAKANGMRKVLEVVNPTILSNLEKTIRENLLFEEDYEER